MAVAVIVSKKLASKRFSPVTTLEEVGGRLLTATDTNDSTGDTSEFSENKEVFGTVSLP